jgi:lipoprotein NlpD
MAFRHTALALCCAVLIAQLAACGGHSRAPVEDRSGRTGSPVAGDGYTVQRGDTLYSIAFRYGLDYRRLAAANRIPAPYTIYPGQRLSLREADPPRVASSQASTRRTAPAPPATSTPAPTAGAPAAAVTKPSSAAATTAGTVTKTATSAPVGQWRWPSGGRVIRGYSSTVHKGIDIGGNRGDAVVAVAAGHVVYAGSGIVGLGALLIVKHNDVYLSAYGHNDRLLVTEGDNVTAGQKIAEKGSSGTDSVRLHFEIRKAGKPIDPLTVLPRR